MWHGSPDPGEHTPAGQDRFPTCLWCRDWSDCCLCHLWADFLAGDADIWRSLGGDAGIGLAGFRAFLSEPWSFPLLHVDQLDAPDGIVIVFTDSLSLWALVAKTFRWVGLSAEQWFALWYLLIFSMQGLSAVAAVRSFGVRSAPIEMSVAAIAVSAPIMMLRTWHPGLAAQFTLLLAWAVVGSLHVGPADERAARRRRTLLLATALAVATLLIHPYLFVGVLAIVGAGALGLVARGELSLRRFFGWAGGSAIPVLVAGMVTGLLGSSVDTAAGYGLYGTYVLGPVIPQWSRLWPGNDWILEANGSFEGFNWLGAGWLLIVVAALVLQPRRIWSLVRSHQVVSAVMLVLGLYAIGPVVRLWNDDPHDVRTPLRWVVGDLGLHRYIYGLVGLSAAIGAAAWIWRRRPSTPEGWNRFGGIGVVAGVLGLWSVAMLVAPGVLDRVTGQLRVSGRLLWPVTYGALVVGAAVLSRWSPRRIAVPVLATAAVLQIIDVQQFRDQAHEVFRPTDERVAMMNAITSVVSVHDRVHLEPDFYCAAEFAQGPGLLRFQDVVVAATRADAPVDNVYAARQERSACDPTPTPQPGTDVVNAFILPEGQAGYVIAPEGQECRVADVLVLCTAQWDSVPADAAQIFSPR